MFLIVFFCYCSMRVKESSCFWCEQDYIYIYIYLFFPTGKSSSCVLFFFSGAWGTSETHPRSRWDVFWIPHDVRFQQGARLQMSKDWSKEVAQHGATLRGPTCSS